MNIPSNYQEFFFLSECYEQKITEEVVYKLFIEKVISDYPFNNYPTQIKISQFHRYLINQYGIEIPPTFINSIIKQLDDYEKDFKIVKEQILFLQKPSNLKAKYAYTQQKNNADSIEVLKKFNEYLIKNNQSAITEKQFEETLSIYYSRLTNIEPKEETELSKILVEWINYIYQNNANIKIAVILDKLIYAWLLYSYFYSVKRQNKKLNNNTVIFDTNILIYLLGIDGEEKKYFVDYLIQKLKENNCSILINYFTITELQNVLNKSNTINIYNFRAQNPGILRQINLNIVEFLRSKIESAYDIKLIIDEKDYSVNSEESKDFIASLKQFKHNESSYESVTHDIKLLYSAGEIKKINNIYSEKRLIATSDYVLEYWLRMKKQKEYKSQVTVLLPLDKINLIFWIESDKCQSSHFLRNTWMSVSDSIQYFHNKRINILFSTISEKYHQNNLPPENWRSIYLLLKDSIPYDEPEKDLTKDEILLALQKIEKQDAEENYELLQELQDLREKVNDLSKLEQPIIINNIIEKRADNLKFSELILALLKKIFFFIFRK